MADTQSVRSTTMQHVDPVAVRYFETLNDAQVLYLNSMRIALDPLAPEALRAGASAAGAPAEPLRVALRIDFRGWTAAQHTLSVHVATDCVKRFVFAPGREAAGIPCSARRATSVEITCYNDGQEVDAAEHAGLPAMHELVAGELCLLSGGDEGLGSIY